MTLIEKVRSRQSLPPPPARLAIRLAARLTRAEVAAELGVHPITLARWEGGVARPRAAHLDRYVELLDTLQIAIGQHHG